LIVPATRREWVICPNCHAKQCVFENNAECHGVFVKCKLCKREFEIVIEEGMQVLPPLLLSTTA